LFNKPSKRKAERTAEANIKEEYIMNEEEWERLIQEMRELEKAIDERSIYAPS